MQGYREIADELRQRIHTGIYQAKDRLPSIETLATEFGVARQTARDAIGVLADEGLVWTARGRAAVVRDRRVIRVPLSRYTDVLQPPGASGPWEAACAEQGLNGRMVLVDAGRVDADEDIAAALEVPVGTPLVFRHRHAMLDDSVVQVQRVWYPLELVEGTALAETNKVVGGVFRLLTAVGHAPAVLTERIRARLPAQEDAAELEIGSRVPLLSIERVVRDDNGRALELLRIISAADQIELVYDDLPLRRETNGGTES